MTNQVEGHYAWVFVKNKEAANKLMLGDTVTIIFKKGWIESASNLIK